MVGTDTVVVALGGNALQDPGGEGGYADQRAAVERTADILIELITGDSSVVITHGNGPQIGSLLRQNLEASAVTPPMPLFVNGAQTQGMIGFMIQSTLLSKLDDGPETVDVVPMVTPVEVDSDDPAFEEPTKPIGPYVTEDEAASLEAAHDMTFNAFGADGYRQVVPSPDPQRVYGVETVVDILATGDVPVVAGGGGVPVTVSDNGEMVGVEAVIDKDRTAAVLGDQLDGDVLLILTNVANAALHYGEPDEEPIESMTVETARTYLGDGHFGRGSMYEKVEAACRFVDDDSERRALITRLDLAAEALAGEAGTEIYSTD